MAAGDFGMKLQKLYSLISGFAAHSPLSNLQWFRHFSLSQQWILFVLACFLLCLLYIKFYYPSSSRTEVAFKEFVVEVEGEVRKPGIYTFPDSPRLKEVLEKAGGLKVPAWMDEDTSSSPLKSGALITVQPIPSTFQEEKDRGEARTIKIKIGTMEARKLLLFDLPLDLNRVTAEDLLLLPGIGESLASEIITYRERRKGFRSVEELKEVKGIGEKNWKKFQPFLIVNLE